jgi:hypothetical protein
MIPLPKTPAATLTLKFEANRHLPNVQRLFFFNKGKVYAMTMYFPAPGEDGGFLKL